MSVLKAAILKTVAQAGLDATGVVAQRQASKLGKRRKRNKEGCTPCEAMARRAAAEEFRKAATQR